MLTHLSCIRPSICCIQLCDAPKKEHKPHMELWSLLEHVVCVLYLWMLNWRWRSAQNFHCLAAEYLGLRVWVVRGLHCANTNVPAPVSKLILGTRAGMLLCCCMLMDDKLWCSLDGKSHLLSLSINDRGEWHPNVLVVIVIVFNTYAVFSAFSAVSILDGIDSESSECAGA